MFFALSVNSCLLSILLIPSLRCFSRLVELACPYGLLISAWVTFSYSPFLERYTFLGNVSLSHFDYPLTVPFVQEMR